MRPPGGSPPPTGSRLSCPGSSPRRSPRSLSSSGPATNGRSARPATPSCGPGPGGRAAPLSWPHRRKREPGTLPPWQKSSLAVSDKLSRVTGARRPAWPHAPYRRCRAPSYLPLRCTGHHLARPGSVARAAGAGRHRGGDDDGGRSACVRRHEAAGHGRLSGRLHLVGAHGGGRRGAGARGRCDTRRGRPAHGSLRGRRLPGGVG